MAQERKRPAPNLTDHRSVPSPPPPLEFYVVAYRGLLEWIKKRHPGAFPALSQCLATIGRDWERMRTQFRLEPEALALWMVKLIPRLPSRIWKPGDTCNPLSLLWHYHIASEELRGFPKRARTLTHQKLWLRDRVPGLLKRMREPILPPDLAKVLGAAPLSPSILERGAFTCTCRRITQPPPDSTLSTWAQLPRTQIAVCIVAHHHGCTPKTMRRRLSEASTFLRGLRRDRSHTLELLSSPF